MDSNVESGGPATSPPPPPPPMPHETRSSHLEDHCSVRLTYAGHTKPNMKMRTLNWRRIPKRRILGQQVASAFEMRSRVLNKQTRRQSCQPIMDSSSGLTDSDADNDDDKNVWFLIAKANKSIKEIQSASSTSSTTNTRSASRIREMLESVRKRMAAVTTTSEQFDCGEKQPNSILEAIDFDNLESLFCLNSQPCDLSTDSESPSFVRRSSLRTNGSIDSVLSSNSYCNDSVNNPDDDDDLSFEIENILDSKKSLNVNIFLKQLKSQSDLIEKINRDDRSGIGKERLENLLKLLPDEIEHKQLMKFYLRNRQNRLPIAERFLLQLITEVPNLRLRIQFMLLQEEYHTDLSAISTELDKIDRATSEIRKSKMLRDILNLVLLTGNFLNTGGYAADAAGFSLDCLERLSEVRSNRPGVYLIHYVAEVASKLRILDFQRKELPTIESASRVCIDSTKSYLRSIVDKIAQMRREIDKELENEKADESYIAGQLRTLEDINTNVEFLERRVINDLEQTRKQLADYLCEDLDTFRLNECFQQILSFNQKLKIASEENERRRKLELARIEQTNCSLRRSSTISIRTSRGNRELQASATCSLTDELAPDYANTSNLSRAKSTYQVNRPRDDEQDLDDLHEGLMKLLDDSRGRQSLTGQSRTSKAVSGVYRRTSKIFKPLPQSNLSQVIT